MHVASLAYRTDLIFPRIDGMIADRGGYLAVHTPSNRGFYWGNFLLFSSPPRDGDVQRWGRLFEREFGHDERVRHQSFGWDAPDGERGDVQAFVDAGFTLVDDAVMTIERRPEPATASLQLDIRPLDGDADWAAMNAFNIACDDKDGHGDDYAAFKQALRDRYRAMVEGGLGMWLGAWHDGRLAGGLGLFAAGELARFQSVETHPDLRRRGVCRALVAAACRAGFDELAARRLVIVAEDGGAAQRIYRATGFEVVQRQLGVYRPGA